MPAAKRIRRMITRPESVLSRMQKKVPVIKSALISANRELKIEERRQKFMTDEDRLDIRVGIHRKVNSRLRTLEHYVPLHSILDHVSRGKIAGKNILHLASSTSVYVHFLQEKCHANAIGLDLDSVALDEAKTRGVKQVIHGSAIPTREKPHPLPFKSKSLDFVLSEHFLFSAFHRELKNDPGFEKSPQSIEKSEQALREINRVLKMNGRLIVSYAHPERIPSLFQYTLGAKRLGFIVEMMFDAKGKVPNPEEGPTHFVLRKVKEINQRVAVTD